MRINIIRKRLLLFVISAACFLFLSSVSYADNIYSEDFEDGVVNSPFEPFGYYEISNGVLHMIGYDDPEHKVANINIEFSNEFIYRYDADIFVPEGDNQIVGMHVHFQEETAQGLIDMQVNLLFHTATSQFQASIGGTSPTGEEFNAQENLGQANFNQWYSLGITLNEDSITFRINGSETELFQSLYIKPNSILSSWAHVQGDGSISNPDYYTDNIVAYSVQYTIPPPKLAHFFVQHRVYEDGREFNILVVDIYDENWNIIIEDIVNNVELIGPDGQPVNMSNVEFSLCRIAFPKYDANTGQWEYKYDQNGEIFSDWADYIATINEPLKQGLYRLKVIDTSFDQYEAEYYFNGRKDLPIIRSRSLKYKFDKEDNLIWEWNVPYYLNPEWKTSVRAQINIYRGDEFVGVLYPKVPTHLGRLFVPSDIFQKIKEEGDLFKLQIQLRTNDNNNRSYSKERKISKWKKKKH